MDKMWNKIFTPELVYFMKKVTGDTEDFDTVNNFIEYIKENVNYKEVIILAIKWSEYKEISQVNFAIHYAGEFHASRFILLMDYLALKFKEGNLK